MPASRGTKRSASKSSSLQASSAPKNKKKRGAIQLEVPSAPKKRGRVFACGQGDVGQLGLGEDVVEISKFKNVSALGDRIVDVQAGGMHTIALDTDGKVWTFGCNDEGALGRTTSADSDEGTPKQVSLPGRAVAISAGDSHSAALLDNGDVYAWGAFRDSHGSMGLIIRGREGKSCQEPARLPLTEQVHSIASGGDHLVLLTVSGSVYTMGCGEQGQLGRLSQRSASRHARQGFSALLVPSKVTLKAGACSIWAGYHATFALDAHNDKLFAWGLNNYGQLGVTGEKRKVALFAPTECDAFAAHAVEWRGVACGQHHSLAVDSRGQAYAVGRCEYGRLGLGDHGDAEGLEPIPKLQNKKCVCIAAGTSSSFAVTDSGEVYSWGMGSEGQLGNGTSEDAKEPSLAVLTNADALIPLVVSAGGQHTVVLAEDPSSPKEPTPTPDKETAEGEVEEKSEEEEEKVKEKEKRGNKRQKKQEQEEEISSTSSAQPSEVSEESKPQKVNGDEKKEIKMDVDDTDNTQKEETATDEQTQDTDTKDEKPEQTDTSSQGTTDSEEKSHEGDTKIKAPDSIDSTDVEMEDKTEINGTPESVEPKTVEMITTAKPLTTTA